MPSVRFLLQQPYKKSQNPDKEIAKLENALISKEVTLRKKSKKNLNSLFHTSETRIYLFFIVDRNHKIKLKTDEAILPKNWNFINQRARSSYPGALELNLRLENLKNAILKKYRELVNDQPKITFSELKKELAKELKDSHKPLFTKSTLNEFIAQFIEDIQKGVVLTRNGERYKKGTIKNYLGFQEQFNLFQKSEGFSYEFEDIDAQFYNRFIQFFNTKNYSPNTIGRHIKTLKVIVRNAREKGLTNNIEVDKKSFKTITVESQQIYLTEEELQRLSEINLEKHKTLEIARDIFLLGVRLAQRFSDYHCINQENIVTLKDGQKAIKIIQQKSGNTVYTPIHKQVRKILTKYNFSLPKVYEQKINKRIKEVGELAGINESVTIERIKGGNKVRETLPKYKLIMTHTARRTGITLMYLAGIPPLSIMRISGHKTEREFLKYLKVSGQETAQNLINHEYFSK